MLTRRAALASIPAALATPALPAPALAQGAPFVVATFGGLFEETLRRHAIPEFEKQHGVRVQLELGTGSTFIPKIIASPRRTPYDVVHLNDDEAFLGQALGLWLTDQSAKLPHASETAPTLRTASLPLYTSVVYELPLVYGRRRCSSPHPGPICGSPASPSASRTSPTPMA